MAGAFGADPPEQVRSGRTPGEGCELVDRPDHERRRQAVDLLVDDYRRQPLGRSGRRERTPAVRVAAVQQYATSQLVGVRVPAEVERRPAPRATGELLQPTDLPLTGVSGGVLELAQRLVEGVGRDAGPHPQPDPDGRVPPAGVAGRHPLLTEQLASADEGGGALKLLRSEQPQRVAHEHRDTVGAVARVRAFTHQALQPAYGDCVRRQPEVGLGLATASREEQQLSPSVQERPAEGVLVRRIA